MVGVRQPLALKLPRGRPASSFLAPTTYESYESYKVGDSVKA